MAGPRITSAEIAKLADDVHHKILASEEAILKSNGEIQVRIFRQGPGFEIKLNLTL